VLLSIFSPSISLGQCRVTIQTLTGRQYLHTIRLQQRACEAPRQHLVPQHEHRAHVRPCHTNPGFDSAGAQHTTLLGSCRGAGFGNAISCRKAAPLSPSLSRCADFSVQRSRLPSAAYCSPQHAP
jgi:hypothetical protein